MKLCLIVASDPWWLNWRLHILQTPVLDSGFISFRSLVFLINFSSWFTFHIGHSSMWVTSKMSSLALQKTGHIPTRCHAVSSSHWQNRQVASFLGSSFHSKYFNQLWPLIIWIILLSVYLSNFIRESALFLFNSGKNILVALKSAELIPHVFSIDLFGRSKHYKHCIWKASSLHELMRHVYLSLPFLQS